jgi:hypothetical protein
MSLGENGVLIRNMLKDIEQGDRVERSRGEGQWSSDTDAHEREVRYCCANLGEIPRMWVSSNTQERALLTERYQEWTRSAPEVQMRSGPVGQVPPSECVSAQVVALERVGARSTRRDSVAERGSDIRRAHESPEGDHHRPSRCVVFIGASFPIGESSTMG